MIKLPFTFTNLLDGDEVTIDLYDVAYITAESTLVDDATGEVLDFEKECVIITMNNDSFYVADIPLSSALIFLRNIGELNLKKLLKNCSKIIDYGVPATPSGYR